MILAIALLSYNALARRADVSTEQMSLLANQLTLALKDGSADEWVSQFPTLEEFHQLMDANRHVYGSTLEAAKAEFASTYDRQLLRDLKQSFATVMLDGVSRGIDWNQVKLENWILGPSPEDSSISQLFLVLSDRGRQFTVQIDNILVIHDVVHVGQKAKLL